MARSGGLVQDLSELHMMNCEESATMPTVRIGHGWQTGAGQDDPGIEVRKQGGETLQINRSGAETKVPANDPALDADVAIVGFGPAGATLAGLLGGRGVRVVVIERSADVFPLPRAAHIDHTGLRALQELGCLEALLPTMIFNSGLDFVSPSGQVILRIPSDQPSVSGLPTSMYFHQPNFDRTVRATAAAHPTVEVQLGASVVGLRQDADAVELEVEDEGGRRTVRAGWAVGADGATSTVRTLLGIELEDLEFDERWLVVDIVLERRVDTLPDHALAVGDPRRPLTLIPMPGPRFRFEFMLLPGDDLAEIQRPEVVLEQLLAEWIPPGAAAVERAAVYAFHGLVATEWRRGRVLLCGDAAHQMPPFLGQGMNSGIRDATNLAWKLALVTGGTAPEPLLDTYQDERRPHVKTIIAAAVQFGELVCVTDPEAARRRDAELLGRGLTPVERARFRLPRLTPGRLIDVTGGELFPQPPGAPPRLDDRLGHDVAIVARDGVEVGWIGDDGSVTRPAHCFRLSAIDPDRSLRDWMDARRADVVVVRPDRYVAYAGTTIAEAPPLVRELLAARIGASAGAA
jgi:3-(3-hydroxy-phenyl)propionate hydroxylase